jgi:hypothetical protein
LDSMALRRHATSPCTTATADHRKVQHNIHNRLNHMCDAEDTRLHYMFSCSCRLCRGWHVSQTG